MEGVARSAFPPRRRYLFVAIDRATRRGNAEEMSERDLTGEATQMVVGPGGERLRLEVVPDARE